MTNPTERELIPCRVCGLLFKPSRFDAAVCSNTCAQRLHRGGDLAYIEHLDPELQESARAYQEALAASREADRADTAARRNLRTVKREGRRAILRETLRLELRREVERELELNRLRNPEQMAALDQVRINRRHARQKRTSAVASVLKLFEQEQRNNRSAEAIAAFLNFPVAEVVQALAELSGQGAAL